MTMAEDHQPGSWSLALSPGQWSADPNTGIVQLTEAALARLINTDPIDKWYQLDPEPIARGQFAVVYHCRHRITGEEFAAKFSSRWRLGADCTADILHEVAVSAILRPSQRTIQLQDVFSTQTELVLVMEYAAGGDLQTLLDEDMVPYERDVISFTRQLLEGLVFIHDRNIVHLDIKPQNLVLMGEFPDCAVKLCDFEISRVLTPGREVREILGTPDYVAPEIILYEPITTKTDMWSLGVLTYVLLTGFLPFGGDTDQETFLEISLGELDFPEELFEDISADAIDFIKKLLVRQPQSRMSGRECLEHPWMKADLSKAKIPPQPLTASPPPAATPVITPSPTKPTTQPCAHHVHTSTSIHSPSLMSALSEIITSSGDVDLYTKSLSNTPGVLTPSNTPPAFLTPSNNTPTVLSPMSSSPRDIGLPPIHPLTGPKSSAVNSAYSSTSSLYRGGSRQSLDRARSLSKSREVLSERMQMSNQKKSLSKSRERLHEGQLRLSRSREDLWALKSFSHSEEALSAFSWMNEDDSIYKSCNNVFLPMLPMLDENRVSGRLYKSLASIDKIDEVGTESNQGSERQSIFDSRFSINDEKYNHLITKYNTAVNSHIKSPPRGHTSEGRQSNTVSEERLKGNCQGGRNANVSTKQCSRHNQSESQPTQKVTKVSRAERMKREAHKKRKGKRDKEKQMPDSPRLKQQANELEVSRHPDKLSTTSRASSPSKRRGSVSHTEQRIQERHERQQEKLERQGREEKLERRGSGKCAAINSRRRDSGEDKTHKEKNKNNRNRSSDDNINSPRSTSPSKQAKLSKTRSASSDASSASSASSLESVKESADCNRASHRGHETSDSKKSPRQLSGASNDVIEHREKRTEMDEAYVSLEEPVDDGIFSRSESMDSTNTVESDHTVRATDTSSDTLESTFASCTVSENESDLIVEKPIKIQLSEKHELEIARKESKTSESTTHDKEPLSSESIQELMAINEEEEDERSVFGRSVSTSSDIGSMMSETSEPDKEDCIPPPKPQESDHLAAFNWTLRGRSMSMQPSDPPPFSHLNLCRSNSFNLGMPLGSFVASPWGDVCDGAISRAMEMFKLKSTDLTTASRSVQERRPSLHSQ
nr:cyclin-dependent kinase-like 5 [Procambarus clarkii]